MEQQQQWKIQVSTASGELLGSKQTSCQGDDYFSFKGIPYAKPPVGSLRFRDPEPLKPWTGVREAFNHGPTSAQLDHATGQIHGSEDCLYLNVYTRGLDEAERMPVMLWIHGGGFLFGSGDDISFGPDYFMTKRVVLVTINYRLGVLGFLNLEDEVASGNQGLKDQVTALKWVRENITNFGGDPDNVTIFGASAGAASVHYLCLSPLARGLFHKAICQSGDAFCPWASKSEPIESVYEFLDHLGCKDREPKAIVEFLRSVNYKKLIEAQEKLLNPQKWLQMVFPFGPGIDEKSDNPFLPVPIAVAAEEGVQVPLMIGYNSLEAIFLHRFLQAAGLKELNGDFDKYIGPTISDQIRPYGATLADLKQLYFNGEDIGEHNLRKIMEFWGDLGFVEPIHRLVRIQFHNSAAPTYLYKLSFEKNITLTKKSLGFNIDGVSHGDELTYLFRSKECEAANLEQLQPGTGADKVMKRMIELWVNFAQTGRPTPVKSELVPYYWQPLASHVVLRYLNIDEELRMEKMLNIEQRYSFKKTSRQVYY
ncbi:carboxylesterase clade A, member 5 [Nasonia vitripennis]|uniref:Carboxylic ester hydrolase n=1 Tax=Nasonia vitripennis TaxID=7425 RepID=A0A7M6UDJ1_NASVI|nr:carboxylesterase clade A, member 5 [Nasonia vitripennis]